jgi:hypothetical protein
LYKRKRLSASGIIIDSKKKKSADFLNAVFFGKKKIMHANYRADKSSQVKSILFRYPLGA